jgi:hypothetical protein
MDMVDSWGRCDIDGEPDARTHVNVSKACRTAAVLFHKAQEDREQRPRIHSAAHRN